MFVLFQQSQLKSSCNPTGHSDGPFFVCRAEKRKSGSEMEGLKAKREGERESAKERRKKRETKEGMIGVSCLFIERALRKWRYKKAGGKWNFLILPARSLFFCRPALCSALFSPPLSIAALGPVIQSLVKFFRSSFSYNSLPFVAADFFWPLVGQSVLLFLNVDCR